MPVALAFDETQAVAWIDLGYSELAFESLLSETKNENNIYDYTTVLNAMKVTSNDNSNHIIGKLVAILIVIALGGSIFAFTKLSKSKSVK